MQSFIKNGGWGYLTMMSARPQAVGNGLTDSPAGLAGWMLVHGGFGKRTYGNDPKQTPTLDEVLDNFPLHWLTNTMTWGDGAGVHDRARLAIAWNRLGFAVPPPSCARRRTDRVSDAISANWHECPIARG
jgi:hypothetical protein